MEQLHKRKKSVNVRENPFWCRCGGCGVAGEGRLVGVPKFHSRGM